jgi:hypothetical protein
MHTHGRCSLNATLQRRVLPRQWQWHAAHVKVAQLGQSRLGHSIHHVSTYPSRSTRARTTSDRSGTADGMCHSSNRKYTARVTNTPLHLNGTAVTGCGWRGLHRPHLNHANPTCMLRGVRKKSSYTALRPKRHASVLGSAVVQQNRYRVCLGAAIATCDDTWSWGERGTQPQKMHVRTPGTLH